MSPSLNVCKLNLDNLFVYVYICVWACVFFILFLSFFSKGGRERERFQKKKETKKRKRKIKKRTHPPIGKPIPTHSTYPAGLGPKSESTHAPAQGFFFFCEWNALVQVEPKSLFWVEQKARMRQQVFFFLSGMCLTVVVIERMKWESNYVVPLIQDESTPWESEPSVQEHGNVVATDKPSRRCRFLGTRGRHPLGELPGRCLHWSLD